MLKVGTAIQLRPLRHRRGGGGGGGGGSSALRNPDRGARVKAEKMELILNNIQHNSGVRKENV